MPLSVCYNSESKMDEMVLLSNKTLISLDVQKNKEH